MVKTAQSVAHRLKEDESGDESGRDGKPAERNHIGVQDVGVKVSRSQASFALQAQSARKYCITITEVVFVLCEGD